MANFSSLLLRVFPDHTLHFLFFHSSFHYFNEIWVLSTPLINVCIVKAMVFPVVMYGCESWAIEKAEHWRTDAFQSWCWRRLLRVPRTVRRSNQSILKEINPEYSLAGQMLKLKFQYFGHLMWRADSLEKTLILGKIEGRRRRGWQRIWCLDGVTKSMDISLSKLREMVKDRKAWHAAIYGVTKNRTWLSNWTTTPLILFLSIASVTSMLSNPLANSQFYFFICIWTFWLVSHSFFKQFLQVRSPPPTPWNTIPLDHLTFLVPLLNLHSGFSLLPDCYYFKCPKSQPLEVFPSLCTFTLKGTSYKPWF